MFDLFGPSSTEINRCFRHSAENVLAIMMVLNEKGIMSDEEFAAARLRAISELDQHLAKEQEDRVAAMSEGERVIYNAMRGRD